MKLWLHHREENLLCYDVSLKDGALPCINDDVIDGIEPGIWSKVLVLKWINIDLEKPFFHWTTCSCDLGTRLKQMMESRPEFICQHNQHCYLKSDLPCDTDLSKVLEIVRNMLEHPNKADHGRAVQLLHVHILPAIKFTADLNMEDVNQAIQEQNENLARLNTEFDEIAVDRENKKPSMRYWRSAICECLDKQKFKLAECGVQFLELFLYGLKRDLKHTYAEIEYISEKVEMKKNEADNCSPSELQVIVEELDTARKERDDIVQYLSVALFYREEIEMFLKKGLVKAEPEQLPDDVVSYIKTIEDFQEATNKKYQDLSHKKICAISVREALHRTQQDLKDYKESSGLEQAASGTSHSSDVLPVHMLPEEWQTVQSQVINALEKYKELRALKEKFASEIITICNIVNIRHPSDCQKVSTAKPEAKQKTQRPKSELKQDHQERVRLLRESFRRVSPHEHYQSVALQLQKKIHEHFEMMSLILVRDFLPRGTCRARAWVCYERCLFPDLFTPYIVKLYENAFVEDVAILRKTLPDLTVEDLDMAEEINTLNLLGLYIPDSEESKVKGGMMESIFRSRVDTGVVLDDSGQPVRRRGKAKSDQHINHRKSRIVENMLIVPHRSFSHSSKSMLIQDLNKLSLRRRYTSTSQKRPGGRQFFVSDQTKFEFGDSGIYGEQVDPGTGINVLNHGIQVSTLSMRFVKVFRQEYDLGIDANTLTESEKSLSSSANSTDEKVKKPIKINREEFCKLYEPAINSFLEISCVPVPMKKFQWILKCINQIDTIAKKQAEMIQCGQRFHLNGDDIMTMLILFLTFCDPEKVAKTYPHIHFLAQYLPPFLDKGEYGFTISQFYGAYEYIMKTKKKKTVPVTSL